MKLYADTPALRAKQVLGDALALVWVAVWVVVGRFVRSMVEGLAGPVWTFRSAGANLSSTMSKGADAVRDLPMVGDRLVAPFDGAAGTGDGLVRSSDQLVARITEVALWTALLTAGVPIVLGLAWWLGTRLRFVRTASMTQRFIDADADLDLFALRAMANQPLERLDAVSHDPVGAWRARDVDAIRRLAAMELADAGLRAPAARPPAAPDAPAAYGTLDTAAAPSPGVLDDIATMSAREYRATLAAEREPHATHRRVDER